MKICKLCLDNCENPFGLKDPSGNIYALCQSCVFDLLQWNKNKHPKTSLVSMLESMELSKLEVLKQTIMGPIDTRYYGSTIYGTKFKY